MVSEHRTVIGRRRKRRKGTKGTVSQRRNDAKHRAKLLNKEGKVS